jgi:hypothetical protein
MGKMQKFYKKKLLSLIQFFRIAIYRMLSSNKVRKDYSNKLQPVMFEGNGEINIGR